MATSSISVNCGGSQKRVRALPSLSGWLSAHGSDAAVRSIKAVRVPDDDDDTVPALLPLPMQQLQGLKVLCLDGVNYAPLQHSSSSSSSTDPQPDNAPALVLADLAALTSLELSHCQGKLAGLASCTGLQQLVARAGQPSQLPFKAQHLAAQLSQALPELTALTQLVLGGPVIGSDDVVQHVSSLSQLQDLTLRDSTCSASSFQQLPQSLTALNLRFQMPEFEGVGTAGPVISPGSTPGLCQLTGLRKLNLEQVDSFSLEVLAGLTSLEELQFHAVEFKEPGTLSVLTALTQLKHLELPAMAAVYMPTPADVAAATASSHLTYLDISESHRSYPQHQDLFPPGGQLPHLVELHVSLGMMERSAGKAAATCCPNLQKLLLCPNDHQDFAEEAELDEEAWGLSSMLEAWQRVQSLTCLTLNAGYTPMDSCVWEALGALTRLRKLEVEFMGLSYISGVLCLGRCRSLEVLHVTGTDAELFHDVEVDMLAKAGEDGTTDIYERLPQYLQKAALSRSRMDHFGQHPKLVKTLLKIAADAQHEQQKAHERLQRQVAELQQQVAELKAGAAQQVQLEQRVVDLQTSLAAVLRQLPSMGGAAP